MVKASNTAGRRSSDGGPFTGRNHRPTDSPATDGSTERVIQLQREQSSDSLIWNPLGPIKG